MVFYAFDLDQLKHKLTRNRNATRIVCVSKILENNLCNLQPFKIVYMAKVNIKERNFIIKILKFLAKVIFYNVLCHDILVTRG